MAIIPGDTLLQLRCDICLNYLSKFPIMQSVDGETFCGTCQKTVLGKNLFRVYIFEALAKHIKFPCTYTCEGCSEMLYTTEIDQHEKYCNFKIFECPLAGPASCQWRGYFNEILEHCEKGHKKCFMENYQFDIDLCSKHDEEEERLIMYDNEVFLFRRKFEVDTNNLTFTIMEIEKRTTPLNYQIILNDQENNFLGKSSDTQQNMISICVDIYFESCDFLRGEIKFSTDGNNFDEFQINKDMLEEIKCLICLEYMSSPIRICINGHSLCSGCKKTIKLCPACNANTTNYKPDIITHNLISQIIGPCKNHLFGCKFISKFKILDNHQKFCTFGIRHCPLDNYNRCTWTGPIKKFYDHIQTVHNLTWKIEYKESLNAREFHLKFSLLKFANKYFLFNFRYERETWYWALNLMGLENDCGNFGYELSILREKDGDAIMAVKKNCFSFDLYKGQYDFGNPSEYIFLSKDQIKYAINNDNFWYKIDVFKK